jgi:hypothetical protein
MFNIFCIFAFCMKPKTMGGVQKVCQSDCRRLEKNKDNCYEYCHYRHSLSLPWWFGSF